MNQEFRNKPVNEIMMLALYNRFRPLRIKPDSAELSSEMDVLDFCLGINCLSRCQHDIKIKIMFELCDTDDDGCMKPTQILHMLQKIERVFVRETARIELQSQTLLNSLADKRAEANFNFIMTTIRQ